MRRYVVSGTQNVQDPKTSELVEPGGELSADPTAEWTKIQVESGVLMLAGDLKEEPAPRMPCPLCTEQGKTKVPAFTTLGELEAHYTDRHAGFVVPEFEPKEA